MAAEDVGMPKLRMVVLPAKDWYRSRIDAKMSGDLAEKFFGQVVDALNELPEKDLFYRGLISWDGFENSYVSYKAKARANGKSSYSFKKMFSLARVGITSFSMLPMKIIIFVGGILFMVGTLILMVMLYYKYFISYSSFSGTAILAAFIIVNNGILIILVGIISTYQINMIKEIKSRPNYIIEDKINL